MVKFLNNFSFSLLEVLVLTFYRLKFILPTLRFTQSSSLQVCVASSVFPALIKSQIILFSRTVFLNLFVIIFYSISKKNTASPVYYIQCFIHKLSFSNFGGTILKNAREILVEKPCPRRIKMKTEENQVVLCLSNSNYLSAFEVEMSFKCQKRVNRHVLSVVS